MSGFPTREDVLAELARREAMQQPVAQPRPLQGDPFLTRESVIAELQRRGEAVPDAQGFIAPQPRELSSYIQPQGGTIAERISGGLPKQDLTLNAMDPGSVDDERVASIVSYYKKLGNASVTPEVARKMLASGTSGAIESQAFNPNVAGQHAAARLQEEAKGTFRYANPEQRQYDLELLGHLNAMSRTSRNQARLEQTDTIVGAANPLGPLLPHDVARAAGRFGGGAIHAASLGIPEYLRGLVQPDTAGMEQAPVSTGLDIAGAAGEAAGALATGFGAGKVAAGIAPTLLRARPGTAILMERAAAATGGFIGGNLPAAPQAFFTSLSNGATPQDAVDAAVHSQYAIFKSAGKALTGEHLTGEDYGNLAMLGAVALGVGVDLRGAIQELQAKRPLSIQNKKAIDQAIRQHQQLVDQLTSSPEYAAALAQKAMDQYRGESPQFGETAEPNYQIPDHIIPAEPPRSSTVQQAFEPVRSELPPEPTGTTFGDLMNQADTRLDEQVAKDFPGLTKPDVPRGTRNIPVGQETEANLVQAEPLPKAERIHPDDIVAQAEKDHPGQGELIRTMMGKNPGPFVRVNVPLGALDIAGIVEDAKSGMSAIRPQDVRRYATMPQDQAPPVIGVTHPSGGDALFVADGRHRALAAALRAQKGGFEETVPAIVPESWAAKHGLIEAPAAEAVAPVEATTPTEAAPAKKGRAAKAQDAVLDKLRAVLDKNPDISIRNAAKEIGSNFGTTRRAMLRLKAEKAQAEAAPEGTLTTPEEASPAPEKTPLDEAPSQAPPASEPGSAPPEPAPAAPSITREDLNKETLPQLRQRAKDMGVDWTGSPSVLRDRIFAKLSEGSTTPEPVTQQGGGERPTIPSNSRLMGMGYGDLRRLAKDLGLAEDGNANDLRNRLAKARGNTPAPQQAPEGKSSESVSSEPPKPVKGVKEKLRKQKEIDLNLEVESFMQNYSKWGPAEARAKVEALSEEAKAAIRDRLEKAPGRLPQDIEDALGVKRTDTTTAEGQREAVSEDVPEEPLTDDEKASLEQKVRSMAGSGEDQVRALGRYLEGLSDQELEHLATRFNKGSTGRLIKAELASRESGTTESFTPDNTSPATATNRIKAQAAVNRATQALVSVTGPHALITDLARKLGLSEPGVGGSKILKRWALGFYRTQPESIRLRRAGDVHTEIHEIGHALHKILFQGGKSELGVRGRKLIAPTGLDQGVFPSHWAPELQAMGEALYGSQKPAAGYLSEGWAELIRNVFTNNLDATYEVNGKMVKVEDMTSYKEMMSKLSSDFPEVMRAMDDFRKKYEVYVKSSLLTRFSKVIRREAGVDERASWWHRLRQSLFDSMEPLVQMKRDLETGNLRADEDPEVVARRAFGRSGGDLKRAISHGTFDPRSPDVVTGPSLTEVLKPVRKSMAEFEDYLVARRVLEKRAQGFKGMFPEFSDADVQDVVNKYEAAYPEFKKVAQGFQKFNNWLIETYAVGHGLITEEVAAKIISQNLEYITFKAVKTPGQRRPMASGGTPPKYVETGSGIRRLSRDMMGRQIEPPVESFVASMQGIMRRAQMNRVGQVITNLFGAVDSFTTMPRWRLEMIAEDHGLDPTLPRLDLADALNKKGIRVAKVEGVGRWIDRIDRPMDAIKMSGEDVRAELEKRLRALGHDTKNITDPVMEGMLTLAEAGDFITFRPGFRVDKSTRQFSVLKDGKPTFWEAKHDGLYQFLEGFTNPAALDGFAKVLSAPGRLFRAGATQYNPSFFVVNFLRDLSHALVVSDIETSGGITGLSARTTGRLKGILQAFKSGDPGQMYLASGADMAGFFSEYVDPKTKAIDLDKMFDKPKLLQVRGDTIAEKAFDLATTKPLWRLIKRLNERFELANRLGEFEAQLAQSDVQRAMDRYGTKNPTKAQVDSVKLRDRATVEQAGQAAADVTLDFSRGGTLSKQVNQYIPFFNAAMIGADKIGRFIRQNPYRAVGRIFEFIIAPSIVSHLMNRDDKKYWNIPYELRDRYWHFPLGDVFGDGTSRYLRIPKPYGLGAFAIATERMLASVDGIDPISGKRGDPKAFKGMGPSLISDFRPPYNVPIVTPMFELYLNRSIYTGAEIVRTGEQTGPPGERGAERSSELARTVGGLMDIPPPQVDYLIEGITGGLGREATDMVIDPSLRIIREDALGYEPRPTRRDKPPLSVYPLVPALRRLIVDEPKTYTETLNRFWQTFDEAQRYYRGMSSRKDSQDRFDEYVTNNLAKIEEYKSLIGYKTVLDKLFKEYTRVARDQKLEKDDREKQLKSYIEEINSVAREGMDNLDKNR